MNYDLLATTISSLTEGETDEVALMATVACEIHHSDTRFDWTGFYRVTSPEVLKIERQWDGINKIWRFFNKKKHSNRKSKLKLFK